MGCLGIFSRPDGHSSTKRTVKHPAVRAALALLLLAIEVPAGWAQTPEDEQALRTLWQQFETAFNAGDAAKVASFFTATADRISGTGAPVRGRAEIEQQYANMMARRRTDPASRPLRATITIRFVRADIALVDGYWTGERAGERVAGRFTLIAVQENGRWWIDAGRAWDFSLP